MSSLWATVQDYWETNDCIRHRTWTVCYHHIHCCFVGTGIENLNSFCCSMSPRKAAHLEQYSFLSYSDSRRYIAKLSNCNTWEDYLQFFNCRLMEDQSFQLQYKRGLHFTFPTAEQAIRAYTELPVSNVLPRHILLDNSLKIVNSKMWQMLWNQVRASCKIT